MAERPFVSVCIPVKNGEGRLENCLRSLMAQTYPKDRFEIIIADGRSTDRTADIARSFGARVLDNPRQIVASGRNVAFRAAHGDVVASTDDDCVLPPTWLATGVNALIETGADAIGGPSLVPDDATPFAQAAGFVFRLASMAGYSVQSDYLRPRETNDIPGCNALYRRSSLMRTGLFDEELLTAEDVDLHLRMSAMQMRLLIVPSFVAWHHKRETPLGLFRQMRRFAVGRLQVGRKHKHAVRPLHTIAAIATPLVLLALLATALFVSLAPVLTVVALAWLALATVGRVSGESFCAALLILPVLAIMLSGWSWGFLREWLMPMQDTAGQ